jgi:hypothetical protein
MPKDKWLEDELLDYDDDDTGSYWDKPIEEVPKRDPRILKQERHQARLRRQFKEQQSEGLDS